MAPLRRIVLCSVFVSMLATTCGGKLRIMRQKRQTSDAGIDVCFWLASPCFRRSRAELFGLLSGIMVGHCVCIVHAL